MHRGSHSETSPRIGERNNIMAQTGTKRQHFSKINSVFEMRFPNSRKMLRHKLLLLAILFTGIDSQLLPSRILATSPEVHKNLL